MALQLMRFTFIHTADWQIGKRFGGLDERLAGRLEEARLDAIDRIAQVASLHGARHVLVAGDVYDAPDLKEKTVRQPLTRMAQHGALTWVLLPGNHDPAGPGSIWSRVRRYGVADNIILADRPEPITLATGVTVLPAPLTAKATRLDPTAWMNEAGADDGGLRIGLAHGSVHGFGSQGECQVLVDPARVDAARLDYLALGDWHGTKQISERCWYAGTPEPDNTTNNAKGQVLVVTLDRSGTRGERTGITVTPVASGHYVWARVARQIAGAADLVALEREIAELAQPQKRLLLTLRLSGGLQLCEHAALERLRAELDARVQHLDWRETDVTLLGDVDEAQLDQLAGTDGELRAVIARLVELARDDGKQHDGKQRADGERNENGDVGAGASSRSPGRPDPAVARSALLKLLAFARTTGEAA